MLCDIPCKIVLVIINIVTFLIGVALMSIGGIMTWGQSAVQGLLSKFLEPLISQLHPSSENIVALVQRILTSTGPIGIAIFIVGAILSITAIIGFIGVCCSKIFLYIYAALMGALAVAVMAIFIYYYVNRDKIANQLADVYATSVKNYVSLVANNEDSLAVLLIQGQLQCCGDNDYTDFINKSPSDTFGGQNYNGLVAPIPCCNFTKEFEIADKSCPAAFNDQNSNWKTGCRGAVKEFLVTNMNIVAYVMIGIFVVLLLLMVLAILAAVCY